MRLIDADALKVEINDKLEKVEACAYMALRNEVSRLRKGIDAAIDSAPTIDAEPVRHGRWEDIKGAIRCSGCQNTPLYDYHGRLVLVAWCPVCGAKMWKKRGEENGKGD